MDLFEKDKDITGFTTFGVAVKASYFAEYASAKELIKICRSDEYRDNRVLHIGGGSNLLFERNFDGLILHSGIRGIETYKKNEETVYVIAGAGEKWETLVDYCIDNDIAGLENLAGIPGEVGAAPVQNVGAYGVEAGDIIWNVECLDRETLEVVTIKGTDCGFTYRDSKFKNEFKDRYFILRVSFRLKPGNVAKHLEYAALSRYAKSLDHEPTIREIGDEVIRLRNSKLPDPKLIGSAGSFFKNPVVRKAYYDWECMNFNTQIPSIPVEDGRLKIPAGWLIEKCGMRGVRKGGAYIYPENCLVIANDGTATAQDIKDLAKQVYDRVLEAYHIALQPEVNFIDSDIKVTVLGSGTSKGVPELLCRCETCTSNDPKDKRMRASVLVETMGVRILIDPSPDFREQAIRYDIGHIDAVLITHEHYDHVGGIDDLRPYCFWGPLDIYCREDVNEHLHSRLDYCFKAHLYPGVPTFRMHTVENHPFFIKGVRVEPIEVMHGKLPIFGYRIGKFAYVTDAKTISEEEREKLYNLDTLIVNGLRFRDHFAHFSIPEALELIKEVKPRHAYLTHVCHEVGRFNSFAARLPEGVAPAYDGQQIVVR